METPAVIVDPGTARGLLAGSIVELRRLAASPLASCAEGDRLAVAEGCVLATTDREGRELSATSRDATVAVFADGWRQHRDGRGHIGARPTNPRLIWTPAIRMPRWAARAGLTVTARRIEPLRTIDRGGLVASGLRPMLGGLLWRWSGQPGGPRRDPLAAFAAAWDRDHPTPGERWADDPPVVVLGVRYEAL